MLAAMGRWTTASTGVLGSLCDARWCRFMGIGRAVNGGGLRDQSRLLRPVDRLLGDFSEVLYRFHSQHLRWISGLVGFVVAGIFGITPFEMWDEPSRFWWVILFCLPGLLALKSPDARRYYWPWFLLGMASYLLAFAIWQTGKPAHSWCNPDSLVQAHGIWHLLSATATIFFFVFLRTERKLN